MKILNRERRSGKTMRMIYASEVTGFRIITPTRSTARDAKALASELGCDIPEPICVEEFKDVKLHSAGFENCGILIDEAESIIQDALEAYFRCPVHAISLSVEMAKSTSTLGKVVEKL